MLPRIPQPQSYHLFADERSLLGIANSGDVASNAPFAVIGIWGLIFLVRTRSSKVAAHFLDVRERWPYVFVFVGLLLTAFGSAYYHLAPDNARLLWDRLPMTITFMAMVSAVIAERINVRLGVWLLPVLLLIGLASVLQWEWSESRGAGDLRFYAAVQGYSALIVLLALFLPRRYTHTADFGLIVGFYALAKVLETFDKAVFTTLHIVSGHTLKHLAAAAAGYCILRMLQRRVPVAAIFEQHGPEGSVCQSE
jgi:Alkaline phytoceramidase (aPHC).